MSVVMSEPVNDTTRRFARSMREAFADERYPAIEHYRRPVSRVDRILGVALAIVIGLAFALLAVHELAGG